MAIRDGRKKRPFLPAIQQSLILIFLEVSPTQFFDLIDRRYGKEGPHTIIFTSNKQPNEWHEYFLGMDDLMCSLDRIFDKASIFDIKGESYRGRASTTYAVEAG
ncbi:ATP-binding protein [Clostridium vitabionis]|jgi:DNA replication protein DnaC|uniref:ATP-binding protein n=1 Tax=Clostridium vitabionis TaxID=2784388 RepID=UPI00188B5187|nr:ATP-binding protein [Clostridium vitabionis]